ncbi:deoxyguanosinetriphosphate triphosphohydrolase family protein [Agarivorans sp. TSD2052]|uniref:anti-phage deoxyguanosine triphosphatase n=1 Tax=Agarivorans sp. TSD2052 TaxID=2937286 RepID=UPI00200DCFFA|nr:anti-phage deoxyguanosine triphosphatase [Agarivorans sp. TSD2052]UPW19991.1 deoxyguanosinetriphosphate triphosphohydrolase family protein [Agarivorans sp. TSD2052]
MTELSQQAGTARFAEEQSQRRNDHRTPWQRDRARILHSAAFRRLQNKTQVLSIGNNDFYRTRLTHSLEVAQIGTGIVGHLQAKNQTLNNYLPELNLIESLCLAHDIGHPPFGHGGEVALNYMMRDNGGFEGNAQTFRILTKLEPYTKDDGMNLTRRTLLGIIKYPCLLSQLQRHPLPPVAKSFRQLKVADWTPAKGIYDDDQSLYNWVLASLSAKDRDLFTQSKTVNPLRHKKSIYKSLDCSIMELADDIAYGVHDLEDAIVMGIVNRQDWQEQVASAIADIKQCWLADEIGALSVKLFSRHHYDQKDAIGSLVNAFITSISLQAQQRFDEPLLDLKAQMDPPMAQALEVLKRFVLHYVIQTPEIEMVRFKGQQVVMELFQAFASDPERLLPLNTRVRWLKAGEDQENPARVIADYIAGMTDDYANRLFQTLF